MKKYSIFMAAAALVFAASCNKIEEVNTPEPVVETELITVDLNPMTKTALGTEGSTTWDANDVVSVTVDGKKIGDLKLVEGSTFSGEVEAGHNGTALLHYPSGITVVPLTQTAIVGTFADEAALLDGETTMDALRAGEGVTLQNKTALLKFTVAQAGDVTFEVGTKKYTITGCKTGSTYYACVEPMNGVNLIARINGYHSKTTKTTVNIEESKILDLGELPKIMTSYWRVLGGYNEWNWDKGTQMYKEGMIVVKNVKFSQKNNRGFKFCYDNSLVSGKNL